MKNNIKKTYCKFVAYRIRTVGSRKPPPTSTHLLKGDPDSATSPSKYLPLFRIPGQEPHSGRLQVPQLDLPKPGGSSASSSRSGSEEVNTNKRKKLRKRKSRKDLAGKAKSPRRVDGETSPPPPPRAAARSTAQSNLKSDPASLGKNTKVPSLERKKAKSNKRSIKQQVPLNNEKKHSAKGKRKSVTSYDLKSHLSQKMIVSEKFNMVSVLETVKRLENTEKEDQQDIDEVEGSLTSASTVRSQPEPAVTTPTRQTKSKPKQKSNPKNNFRDTVIKAVAKAKTENKKSEETVPNEDGIADKYSEVYAAVDKTNEELEAQIRAMKHLRPPPPAKVAAAAEGRRGRIPATSSELSGKKVALPPVCQAPGTNLGKSKKAQASHQFVAAFDKQADQEFYKDFKFTFIPLPVPADSLPREYILCFDTSPYTPPPLPPPPQIHLYTNPHTYTSSSL